MMAAERQRRWRERQRAGELMVNVRVTPWLADSLYRGGWIRLEQVEDRAAIATAIETVLFAILERDA